MPWEALVRKRGGGGALGWLWKGSGTGSISSGLDTEWERQDCRARPMGATRPWNCSTVCPGFPWISSAPEPHRSWQARLQPPSLPSRCGSSGQNSLVPRSWCGQSVFSSSSAGASLPHNSPVCAKIHSYSLMVPASGLCQRPQRALALLLTSQSSLSGGTAPWIHTAGWS